MYKIVLTKYLNTFFFWLRQLIKHKVSVFPLTFGTFQSRINELAFLTKNMVMSYINRST